MNVLEAPPPRFAADEVAAIAARLFGVHGVASGLGSERDQTFLIDDGAGGGGVIKISNLGEQADVLDLETQAILHIARVDPSLPVALPLPIEGSDSYRATVDGPDGTHFVRLFERMHGHNGGPELADDAVADFAATLARLNVALRSFFHPAAGRRLLWDVANTADLRGVISCITDADRRRLVATVIDRFGERVLPRWPHLRAQIVHGDFNLDNVFLDESERVTGIVDFGDSGHTAQAADFAIALASVLRGRPADDLFRVARIAVDGYARHTPFEQVERDVLGDLVAARRPSVSVALSEMARARLVRRVPEGWLLSGASPGELPALQPPDPRPERPAPGGQTGRSPGSASRRRALDSDEPLPRTG